MRTLTTLPHPTTPPSRPTGPVCDHCRTCHSPAGWQAADDGAQLCERCWQEMTGTTADHPPNQGAG
jgi:hypothetical protein